MLSRRTLPLGALALLPLLTPLAPAQWRPVGTWIGAGDDALARAVPLGITFPFPGGAALSTVDVDSNGRVFLGRQGTSDPSESVGELLGGTPSLAILWDDLVADGGIYFDATNPGVATITWVDVREQLSPRQFTMQLQLLASGQILMLYDSRVPALDGLVGVSDGQGPDPGSSDLSAGTWSAANPTAYELFPGGANGCDLAGSLLVFTPNGQGGYQVVRGTVPDPSFGIAEPGRSGCIERAITFSPNGQGGYVVTDGGTADWDFAQGRALGLGDDQTTVEPLGFTFPLPGGTAVQQLEIDSNGRVFEAGFQSSDFTPTPSELAAAPGATIAPYWTDLDPRVVGEVYAHRIAGAFTVTWAGVPKTSGLLANTVQLRVEPDGTIQFLYFDVAFEPVGIGRALLIGLSRGGLGTAPAEVDLSALPRNSGTNSTVYEWFDVDNGDRFDLDRSVPRLRFTGLPDVGQRFTLDVVDAPPGTAGLYYLAGQPVSLPLASIAGLEGCILLTDSSLAISPPLAAGTPLPFVIPSMPSLAGATANFQAIVVGPNLNAAGVLPTDELLLTIGR